MHPHPGTLTSPLLTPRCPSRTPFNHHLVKGPGTHRPSPHSCWEPVPSVTTAGTSPGPASPPAPLRCHLTHICRGLPATWQPLLWVEERRGSRPPAAAAAAPRPQQGHIPQEPCPHPQPCQPDLGTARQAAQSPRGPGPPRSGQASHPPLPSRPALGAGLASSGAGQSSTLPARGGGGGNPKEPWSLCVRASLPAPHTRLFFLFIKSELELRHGGLRRRAIL